MQRWFSIKKLLFLFLFLFLVIFLILKSNLFSVEKVKMEILAPGEIEFGKEIEMIVKIKNNSKFRLLEPQLIFDPPSEAYFEDKPLERQILSKDKIGEFIYPGDEKSFSFKMKLFGESQEKKVARATLFFQPKNLKAKFKRETSFTGVLLPPSVNISLDLPSKVISQREFEIYLTYYSNSETPLLNLAAKIEFPEGFEIINSSPPPKEKNLWEIPLLNFKEGGKIKIIGKFGREEGAPKIFTAKLGYLKQGEFFELKKIQKGTEISKPSVFVRQEINGLPEYIARPGEYLHYQIFFKNIGEEPLENQFLIIRLEGEAFDFSTLKTNQGIFNPTENTILFDPKNLPILQMFFPQDEGKVDFWIKVKDDVKEMKNLNLKNVIILGPTKNEFSVKVSSPVDFIVNAFFEDEIFGNSGSIPPTVSSKTTYTILWKIKTYHSGFKNGKVLAKLSKNVSFLGKVFPQEQSQNLFFDSQNQEILWTIENLEKEKEISVAFQIQILPTNDQKGQVPILISDQRFSYFDEEIKKELILKAPDIDTTLLGKFEIEKAEVK